MAQYFSFIFFPFWQVHILSHVFLLNIFPNSSSEPSYNCKKIKTHKLLPVPARVCEEAQRRSSVLTPALTYQQTPFSRRRTAQHPRLQPPLSPRGIWREISRVAATRKRHASCPPTLAALPRWRPRRAPPQHYNRVNQSPVRFKLPLRSHV